jgi:hypothetical protein
MKKTHNFNLRMKYLQMANAGDNPVEAKTISEVNDLLAEMRDEGLIKFRPDNKISKSEIIVLTDIGHKRLDEMKRSKYPDFLKWSALSGIVALIIFLVTWQ